MANEALERVWMRVRDELRRQRGLNNFRGSEVHLLPKKEVRIPVENRDSRLRNSEVVIHLTEVEADLWAIQEPEGERLHISEDGYRLAAFVERIVKICRGDAYLHTNSEEATYRKQQGNDGNAEK